MKLGLMADNGSSWYWVELFKKLDIEKIYLSDNNAYAAGNAKSTTGESVYDGRSNDYREILKSDVDTIFIDIRPDLHKGLIKEALLSGKNVIVNRPLAGYYKTVKELITLAKSKNLFLLEAVSTFYLPAYRKLLYDLDKVGKIEQVNLYYCKVSPRYDEFKEGKIHASFDPKKFGGAMWDNNICNVNFLLGLFGSPSNIEYFHEMEKGCDVSGTLICDYGDFKAKLAASKIVETDETNVIAGNKGRILIDSTVDAMDSYCFIDNNGKETIYRLDYKNGPYFEEFKELFRIINEKNEDEMEFNHQRSLMAAKLMDLIRIDVK